MSVAKPETAAPIRKLISKKSEKAANPQFFEATAIPRFEVVPEM